MRKLDVNSVSEYVVSSFDVADAGRKSELMTGLVVALHDYIRKVKVTHEEWKLALDFFETVGKITTPNRNEFMLLSDVLGVTSLVDLLAEDADSALTPASPLGPYYLPEAPFVEQGGLICREDEPGTPTLLKGRVIDEHGNPAGAGRI